MTADEDRHPLTDPYWDAARRRRLAIQRCARCDRYWHPPAPECRACGATDLVWDEVSGRGVVHAAVAVRTPLAPGHERVPYAGVAVELEEQQGLLVVSRLIGAPVEDARVGLAVAVDFEELADGSVVPQFRPVRAGERL